MTLTSPNATAGQIASALNETQVARILGVSVKTMRAWRTRGIGPRFVHTGPRLIR